MLHIMNRSMLISVRRIADMKSKSAKLTKEQIVVNKTPKGSLDKVEQPEYEDPHLKKHPGGVNQSTGERGGPAGPEPTRYGDWERKGRVSDF